MLCPIHVLSTQASSVQPDHPNVSPALKEGPKVPPASFDLPLSIVKTLDMTESVPLSFPIASIAPPLPGPVNDELQALELSSYDVRDRIDKEAFADTTTQQHYGKYISAYVRWWEEREFSLSQLDPSRKTIPAFPVIPSKVVFFLEYTLNRQRVCNFSHLMFTLADI